MKTDLFPTIHDGLWQCPLCRQWIRLEKMPKHFKRQNPYDTKVCTKALTLTGGVWTKQG